MPTKPIMFAWILCLLMWGGEFMGGDENPVALVFYSFFPAVLWAMSEEQKRATRSIVELRARLDQLERSRDSNATHD